MKAYLLISIFLLNAYSSFSQDYIYKKDKSVQKVKIIEIGVDKIKYKRIEVIDGPTYEILKSDVTKIQYSNGFIDMLNPINKNDSLLIDIPKKETDTSIYSMLYIVFNSGQDESQLFPTYINENYLFTIKNHQRLSYKLYSDGYFIFSRKMKTKTGRWKNVLGPRIELNIKHGSFIGIRINEPYPQAIDPNKRFSLDVIIDSTQFENFMTKEYYGFKPFKGCDIKLEEDPKNRILQ